MAFERVKQFKDLMIDYDAPLAGTVKVYTDMPGATMAQRLTTWTLPATTGRQTKCMPLDTVEGTLIKFQFTPNAASILKLYGATLRLRAIGVYLDGANGEIWSTMEMGFGV